MKEQERTRDSETCKSLRFCFEAISAISLQHLLERSDETQRRERKEE
jgi:hypothetical protein